MTLEYLFQFVRYQSYLHLLIVLAMLVLESVMVFQNLDFVFVLLKWNNEFLSKEHSNEVETSFIYASNPDNRRSIDQMIPRDLEYSCLIRLCHFVFHPGIHDRRLYCCFVLEYPQLFLRTYLSRPDALCRNISVTQVTEPNASCFPLPANIMIVLAIHFS